jgi:hypothetical protein
MSPLCTPGTSRPLAPAPGDDKLVEREFGRETEVL